MPTRPVVDAAERKMATEGDMVRAIRAGEDPQAAYLRYRVFRGSWDRPSKPSLGWSSDKLVASRSAFTSERQLSVKAESFPLREGRSLRKKTFDAVAQSSVLLLDGWKKGRAAAVEVFAFRSGLAISVQARTTVRH
jgi:hypothetical protein